MRHGLARAAAGVALLMAGCGSGTTTTATVTQTVAAATQPPTVSAPTASTAVAAPSTTTAYPVVAFTFVSTGTPRGRWRFTAQLASITENPNGFSGAVEPPQDTYLMVQVNVTSKITGRLVPAPKLTVACHALGSHGWEAGPITATGYDEGTEAPDPTGFRTSLGDGQPHLWDAEWQVPIGTSTANVKCVLRPDPHDSYMYFYLPRVIVAGSGRLN